MARKHSKKDQLDGMIESSDIENDESYKYTKHYWMTGTLGTVYQTFLDANVIIDSLDIPEDEKNKERTKVLDARKTAFGDVYKTVPLWDRA